MANLDVVDTSVLDDKNDAAVLDDDKPAVLKEFEGATLEITSSDATITDISHNMQPEISFAPQPRTIGGASELSRDRPGSVIGRASIRSGSSRTSIKPGIVQSDFSARSYYCYKESHFEKAVNSIKRIIKPELDGELKSSWLLTEIDHWDFEREKIVLLTEYSVFIVKYNFINETLYEYRRVMLHVINSICIGDFQYPNVSLMPDRKHGGIQLRWDKGQQLTFGQKWNPWCTDIPWVTLSHHPLIYNPKENETVTYNVDEFFESLVTAASKVYTEKRPGEKLKVIEGPVVIESYANPASIVYNQSGVGFFRDRNGLSY
ncbi:tumor protein p63-regulated gene 1-like protein [Physella acuta]|uniref:tumor protein p63-regulated gene 1-like protein n=1 Tax=Physella acuta TaxID=109671 RepID=UPI0027DE3898|nr:tumor protein p63-regulated gene 1-like protein [Physella acuta]